MTLQEQRVSLLQERIAGLQAELESVQAQQSVIQEEKADLEQLFSDGLVPQGRVMALERESLRLNGRDGSLEADIAAARVEIGQTELAVVQLERDRVAETADQLRTSFTELAELAPQISALETRLARSELRAPAAGTVFGLTKFTVGGVIRSGEPILDVVPADTRLVVEAQIRPQDRDALKPDMAARVILPAFTELDQVDGTLLRVSADAILDERTGQRYYAGIILVDPDALAAANVALEPGMGAEVLVPLGSRTPWQYLIDPLTRSWDRALNEE